MSFYFAIVCNYRGTFLGKSPHGVFWSGVADEHCAHMAGAPCFSTQKKGMRAIDDLDLRSSIYQDSLHLHRVEPDIIDERSGRHFASVGSCLTSGLMPWVNYSSALQEQGLVSHYVN